MSLKNHLKNINSLEDPKDIDIAITALLEAIEGVNKK